MKEYHEGRNRRLRIGRLGGGETTKVVPVVLPDFPERVIGAGGAIAVTHFLETGGAGVSSLPGAIYSYFFANATLNYHGLPAFLQRLHALISEHQPCQRRHAAFELI
jgi:hypothetical protein